MTSTPESKWNASEDAARLKNSMGRKSALIKLSACFFLFFIVSLTWRFTSLKDILDLQTIISWQQSVKNYPATLLWVIGIYLLSNFVFFPVSILNFATVVTFGPITGNLYAFAGWLCSAALGFGIGRWLGHDWVQRIPRAGIDSVLNTAERHGFLTVLSARIVPFAPFTLVNLFAGASEIHFGDFFFATAIGRIPGMITLSILGVRLDTFLHRQDLASLVVFALTLLLVPLTVTWLCRRFAVQEARRRETTDVA